MNILLSIHLLIMIYFISMWFLVLYIQKINNKDKSLYELEVEIKEYIKEISLNTSTMFGNFALDISCNEVVLYLVVFAISMMPVLNILFSIAVTCCFTDEVKILIKK